jgi:uncharacterized protein YbjT (DUF2867 family)
MLLLTGATGLVGSALLPRLTARGQPVRCLVRDPRRLGPERVRVQIALGDLTDPPSFRNALRGVTTVVHLAAAVRDQAAGSIEELNAIATWRMAEAAERARVERFIFFSALGATAHDRTRFLRAKALAEDAVAGAEALRTTVIAPSLIYGPDSPWLRVTARAAHLPLVPMAGRGRSVFQPIWAEDVADCVVAALDRGQTEHAERIELAGPQTLSVEELLHLGLRAAGRDRPVLPVPARLVRVGLRAGEALLGERLPVSWDEAELLEVSRTADHGSRDAEALGITPRRIAAVLGVPEDPA